AVEGRARRPFQRAACGLTTAFGRDRGQSMAQAHHPNASDMRLVIAASAAGTVFEWYDFFIYATLATIIGTTFVPSGNDLVRQLTVWAGFAVGFGFRPLGAI